MTQDVNTLVLERPQSGCQPADGALWLIFVDLAGEGGEMLLDAQTRRTVDQEVRIDRRAMPADPDTREQHVGFAVGVRRLDQRPNIEAGSLRITSKFVGKGNVDIAINHSRKL